MWNSFSWRLVVALWCVVPVARTFGAGDDNLGFRWKSTAPAGYNVQLVAAKNTITTLGTAAEILMSENATWKTLDPVSVAFTPAAAPDPASPAQLDRMILSMNLTNNTWKDWTGFIFTITDNDIKGDPNTTLADKTRDYPNVTNTTGGSLLHPDRAHFHIDSIQGGQLGFTTVSAVQKSYAPNGNLQTSTDDLEGTGDRGVYMVTMSAGFKVADGATWNPFSYVASATDPNLADQTKSSLLEFHDKIIGTTSSFTFTMQPIVAVPEPAGLSVAMTAVWAALVRRRSSRGHRPV